MATAKSIPSHSGPPGSKSSGASPSPTLYLTNLPEKLRKADLRMSLYTLFSTYGVVLDVNAMRGNKMRGQAHVVMKDVSASTQALRALQGFDFFGKDLKIQYSDNRKGRSHVFNRLEGRWKEANTTAEEGGVEKKRSAFEAPRPGQQQSEADKAGPGLQGKPASEPQGTKRPREEDEEEQQEAPMDEEDDDDDVEMEESDED